MCRKLPLFRGTKQTQNCVGGAKFKGWLAIAKLKPLSLFISLLSMPMKAFDNVKINHHHTSGLFISDNLKSKPTWVTPQARPMIESNMSAPFIIMNYICPT